jgi:RNA polymerase sigma-70 factor (ECF subfamily)
MADERWLSERFEEHRGRLRTVAYRMLGSLSEADDAVQEAWLRARRADTSAVADPRAWLTTIVARVSLNLLRARRSRPEDPFGGPIPDPVVDPREGVRPEHEALLADSVGLALLVVLETLGPPERLAYVLHDMFDLPFEEIAPILERSPAATRQLASRARRRIRAAAPPGDASLAEQRPAVEAFLAASREGNLDGLIAVLHPDVVLRADFGPAAAARFREVRGAAAVAGQAETYARLGLEATPVLVNGGPGVVNRRAGAPFSVLGFTVAEGRIVAIDILADPARLARLDLAGG